MCFVKVGTDFKGLGLHSVFVEFWIQARKILEKGKDCFSLTLIGEMLWRNHHGCSDQNILHFQDSPTLKVSVSVCVVSFLVQHSHFWEGLRSCLSSASLHAPVVSLVREVCYGLGEPSHTQEPMWVWFVPESQFRHWAWAAPLQSKPCNHICHSMLYAKDGSTWGTRLRINPNKWFWEFSQIVFLAAEPLC